MKIVWDVIVKEGSHYGHDLILTYQTFKDASDKVDWLRGATSECMWKLCTSISMRPRIERSGGGKLAPTARLF